MADTATKQAQPTFVGTSKVIETDYPVCAGSIGAAMGQVLLTLK